MIEMFRKADFCLSFGLFIRELHGAGVGATAVTAAVDGAPIRLGF